MDTPTTAFSGKPEMGISQSSHSSSSKMPLLDGSLESANHIRQTSEIQQPNSEAGGAECSAPSSGSTPAVFDGHLDKLRNARRRTERMLETLCPGHNAADASLELAWELIFDLICDQEANDLSGANTLASVIQKLMSAFSQIKNLELKVADQLAREEKQKREAMEELKQANPERGLTEETLREIERKLNLL